MCFKFLELLCALLLSTCIINMVYIYSYSSKILATNHLGSIFISNNGDLQDQLAEGDHEVS